MWWTSAGGAGGGGTAEGACEEDLAIGGSGISAGEGGCFGYRVRPLDMWMDGEERWSR
jgi:hypothetical protein